MPLSLNKLGQILYEKSFIPKRYFRYEGNCVFIEIVSLTSGVSSMLYIPSRFSMPVGAGTNIIDIDLIDFDANADDYSQDPMKNPDDAYNTIDLQADEFTDAAEQLDLKYRRNIEIKSGKNENIAILKDIIRQLKRLQYCVEGLPYDLIIYEGKYIVYMRNNDPDCYIFKDTNLTNGRNLRPCALLPTFIEKGPVMNTELTQVSQGIQKILSKNMTGHATYLDTLIKKKGNLLRFAQLMGVKKNEHTRLLDKYKTLLATLDVKEKNLKEKRRKFIAQSESGSLDKELATTQGKSSFDRKIQNCVETKQKIIDQIIELQTALDTLTLSADKILYDNSVMMDKMFKNFALLIDLSK